ncbi:MAG: single-stranded DNA-binding protein [Clostridia bacterium]|nr:single-stranded DNA-binding protein [Clostridia bacterium]
MLNKVILMGRLTRDPELRSTPNGVSVASFTLAVDRDFAKQGEERKTDFINIVAWRNTADFVSKYFTKGQLVAVSGKLQVRSWDDAQSGQKRYATDVVADEVFFAESKKNSSSAPAGEMEGLVPPPDTSFDSTSVAGFTTADEDLPF